MSADTGQLQALQAVVPGAIFMAEAGNEFIFLPGLTIEVGDSQKRMDALLGITAHGGYPTRLFLAELIAERPTINGQPANWTSPVHLGRTWHTWSWAGVPASLPWLQILLAHLKALT